MFYGEKKDTKRYEIGPEGLQTSGNSDRREDLVDPWYHEHNLSSTSDGEACEPLGHVLGASEITANLYCNCLYLYWEGCVIYSIYLR